MPAEVAATLLPRDPHYANQATGSLFDLAARISQNRIIAGVHYPIDIEAGIAVAIACFNDLKNVSQIWTAANTYGHWSKRNFHNTRDLGQRQKTGISMVAFLQFANSLPPPTSPGGW